MNTTLRGKAHVFGKNVSTDQIYPGQYLDLVDPKEVASHCLEGADRHFSEVVQGGDVVVAGTNFGCGSSREHAVIALVESGVGCVIAESFARIFYRNAVNLALPVVTCRGILSSVRAGDEVEVDLQDGTVTNLATAQELSCEGLSEYALHILDKGGIKAVMREKLGADGI